MTGVPPTSPVLASGPWTGLLTSDAVASVLQRGLLVRAIHPVADTGSTQDVAVTLARGGAVSGTVVVADRQRHGRGRNGRHWDDVPGGGSLALTVLLDAPSRQAAVVPHAAGLAVADAVGRLTPVEPMLKWPNDVVVRGGAAHGGPDLRKLAGVLVQREQVGPRDVLLVGVGLNVDLRAVPAVDGRVCLASLVTDVPGRAAVLGGVLGALDARLSQAIADPQALLRDYRSRSDTIGRRVVVDLPGGRRLVGTATDVDNSGALAIERGGRIEVVLAGTVRDDAPEAVTS